MQVLLSEIKKTKRRTRNRMQHRTSKHCHKYIVGYPHWHLNCDILSDKKFDLCNNIGVYYFYIASLFDLSNRNDRFAYFFIFTFLTITVCINIFCQKNTSQRLVHHRYLAIRADHQQLLQLRETVLCIELDYYSLSVKQIDRQHLCPDNVLPTWLDRSK